MKQVIFAALLAASPAAADTAEYKREYFCNTMAAQATGFVVNFSMSDLPGMGIDMTPTVNRNKEMWIWMSAFIDGQQDRLRETDATGMERVDIERNLCMNLSLDYFKDPNNG